MCGMAAAAALAAGLWQGAQAAPTYRIEAIPEGDRLIPAIASDINDDGVVVGSARPFKAGGETREYARAVLIEQGECHLLFDLLDASGEGWVLQGAIAINSAGRMVGSGRSLGGDRACIATPIAGARVSR
jgi:hypothetical protein